MWDFLLSNTCNNALFQVGYDGFVAVVHQWRTLQLLKSAGRRDMEDMQAGELAIKCLACPRLGVNMPDDWQSRPNRYVHPQLNGAAVFKICVCVASCFWQHRSQWTPTFTSSNGHKPATQSHTLEMQPSGQMLLSAGHTLTSSRKRILPKGWVHMCDFRSTNDLLWPLNLKMTFRFQTLHQFENTASISERALNLKMTPAFDFKTTSRFENNGWTSLSNHFRLVPQTSACNTVTRTGNLSARGNSLQLSVTGAVFVVCRHVCILPEGVIDLDKGEGCGSIMPEQISKSHCLFVTFSDSAMLI
jgi:hypothetical protein